VESEIVTVEAGNPREDTFLDQGCGVVKQIFSRINYGVPHFNNLQANLGLFESSGGRESFERRCECNGC
jgi:hypothetical protein